MSEPIISVSGLRGIVGESLTPETAIRYGCAFAGTLDEGPIVVTRDGRTTGRMLAHALLSGLCAVGREVVDADVAATPTTGVLVREHRAAGGIQITASHNPSPYNGLKLFGPEGRILTAAAGEPVSRRYREAEIAWVSHDRIGRVLPCDDTVSRHAELLLATVDVERIRKRRFRVFLDSNHASSAPLGRRLLDDLGCALTHVGAEPDGRFSHAPEPTEENLRAECGRVSELGADVGFFPDPDGDRLAVVDEAGRYIGEERTLALCLDHVLQRHRGPVVANVATSRTSEDVARRYGVPFFRSAVGEANVVETMLAHDAVLGGEGNGGVIDPRIVYVRDSLISMALVLQLLTDEGRPLSQVVADLPSYACVKQKFECNPDRTAKILAAVRQAFADEKTSDVDGLRIDWPDGWVHIRGSNTEPIMRVIAEARDEDRARALCARVRTVADGVG